MSDAAGQLHTSILILLVIGLVGFVLAHKIFDWLTPGITFQKQLRAGWWAQVEKTIRN